MKILSHNLHKFLLILFSILFIALCTYKISEDIYLESAKDCLSKLDTINYGTQRLSKLELENSPNDELIKDINYIICHELFLNNDINSPNYFENNNDMLVVLEDIFNSWLKFYDEVLYFRENNTRDRFFKASEDEYIKMNVYLNQLQEIINITTKNTKFINNLILINLVVLALILVKFLSDTITELKKNKELSKNMFIDTSTGLYNGSKCKEVLKNKNTNPNQAIIICDLNGLKVTNDKFGHRAGDQLISCFATELKKATSIFSHEVFVGRYGGDEFMVSLDDVEKIEIEAYIKEVNFLMQEFNETQNKPFKLSCAIGYAISTQNTKPLTKQELFDIADENMYKNKIAMKKINNNN